MRIEIEDAALLAAVADCNCWIENNVIGYYIADSGVG